MNDYDVIVIGAGISGLVAGLKVALEGYKVLILEKNNDCLGYNKTFVKGRFSFDTSYTPLGLYDMTNKSGYLNKVFDELKIADDLKLVRLPEAFRVITDDGSGKDFTLPFGIERFIKRMEEYFPGSTKYLTPFFDLASECREALKYIDEKDGLVDQDYMKENYDNFVRIASYSVSKVMDALGIPLEIQEVLNVFWLLFGSTETELSFVTYAASFYDYIDLGLYIPVHKTSEILYKLLDRYLENHGEIKYNCEVKKIMTTYGEVNAVMVNDGTIYYTNHLIANISPNTLVSQMVNPEELNDKALRFCNQRKLGLREVKVYLGLNRSIEELGIKNYSYYLYNSLDSDVEYSKMGLIGENNDVLVQCINKVYPNASLEGTSIVTLTSYFSTNVFESSVTLDNYYSESERIASRMIDLFSKKIGVNISDYIEEIEILTPVSFALRTNNQINGYKLEGLDNVLPRLLTASKELIFKGLRFGGAYSYYGATSEALYLAGMKSAWYTIKDIEGE